MNRRVTASTARVAVEAATINAPGVQARFYIRVPEERNLASARGTH